MGRSIFDIQDDLLRLVDNIEENGGEVDEETLKALEITEQDFKDKIDSYCQVITKYKSEDTCCKEEKQRINSIQTTKKNVIEKLKGILLDAVIKFGEVGKKGNLIVETPTHKLYTVNKEYFNSDETRVSNIVYAFMRYMQEVYEQGILVTGEGLDFSATVDAANAVAAAEASRDTEFDENSPVKEGYIPFTVEDLKHITLNVSFECNLVDMFREYPELAKAVCNNGAISSIVTCADENKIKFTRETSPEEYENITFGKFNIKPSLTIK